MLRGDKLLVAMSSNPDTTYEGFVHDVEETRVKLLFHSKLMAVASKAKIKFDVRFTINRFPQRNFHRLVSDIALQCVRWHKATDLGKVRLSCEYRQGEK